MIETQSGEHSVSIYILEIKARIWLLDRKVMQAKPVTMSTLARKLGLSTNAVSLALRHDPQIPIRTRQKIQNLAQKMGYQKNPTVSHLMAELRRAKGPRYKSTLALLNANLDRDAFQRHPTIPTYVTGCRKRAAELGYNLDEFWLHDDKLDGKRLNQILKARNIRGALVVGLMKQNRLPERFLPSWQMFHTVVTGVRTRDPDLSFASTDHHMLAMTAFHKAIELGYRRPALVLDHVIDELTDGRFSAGVQVAQAKIPASRRTRPFYFVEEARKEPSLFHRWFDKEHPDVLLTLYNVARDWLRNRPDIGFIQLEWRAQSPNWSGMNQHNDLVGEAAVEMLINLIHNNDPGIPEFPRATLIGSTWVKGNTTRLMP